MQVESLHPGIELSEVEASTGFELGVQQPLGETVVPTSEQLKILREQVDPHRYIIGRNH